MATKKQKRARGIAKREAFEAELRASGQHFLKLAQDQRRVDREKEDKLRKDRAIAKSKRLAAQHKHVKEGVKEWKAAPLNKFPKVRRQNQAS